MKSGNSAIERLGGLIQGAGLGMIIVTTYRMDMLAAHFVGLLLVVIGLAMYLFPWDTRDKAPDSKDLKDTPAAHR